jgi:hypothetical protein
MWKYVFFARAIQSDHFVPVCEIFFFILTFVRNYRIKKLFDNVKAEIDFHEIDTWSTCKCFLRPPMSSCSKMTLLRLAGVKVMHDH